MFVAGRILWPGIRVFPGKMSVIFAGSCSTYSFEAFKLCLYGQKDQRSSCQQDGI